MTALTLWQKLDTRGGVFTIDRMTGRVKRKIKEINRFMAVDGGDMTCGRKWDTQIK